MNTIKHILALSFGFLIFCSSLLSQTITVATDPVGYVTVDIKGGGTNIISNAGLLQPISSQGIGAVTNETVLSVDNANYIENEFANTHYVQFSVSGDWAAIESNTGDSIILETPVANGSDLAFVIRPLNTLDSLFGSDNSAGFTGGSSFGLSDKIFIWDSNEQSFVGLYYYNNVFSEWQNISNNPTTALIYPDESMVVLAVNDFELTFVGSVQTDSTSGLIAGSGKTSIVPNPYSVDLKISQSEFDSVLSGGSSFGLADKLFVWDSNSQAFIGLYYYNNIVDEWQNISNMKVTDEDIIPAGGVVVIIKDSPENVYWGMNQPF